MGWAAAVGTPVLVGETQARFLVWPDFELHYAVPEVIILGHKCNYDGRVPDDSKIARIRDWPACKTLTDVRAFLGTTGFMRIWIKNYSAIAQPLVNLTKKGQAFDWTEEH